MMCVFMDIAVGEFEYMCIHTHTHTHTRIYIYIYIQEAKTFGNLKRTHELNVVRIFHIAVFCE